VSLSRVDWETAVELAFTEIATAAGIDLDESKTPGVIAMVRMANERKGWEDFERQKQEEDAKAEAAKYNTMPPNMVGYEPQLVPRFRGRR